MTQRIDHLPYRRLFRRAFFAAVLSSPAMAWPNGSVYEVGRVEPPPSVSQSGDLLLAVYSDGLNADPTLRDAASAVGPGPGRLQPGCLSVVQVTLQSGSKRLADPGRITFGCSDVPADARVFPWKSGAWEAIPARRTVEGRLQVDFTALTTYAIFIPDATPGQI